jgi:hypothetical protein
MREEILKRFFLGEISTKVLADDLVGSMIVEDSVVTRHAIKDMKDDFQVLPEHLVYVCDAVLSSVIKAKYLQAIGFCILASDHFEYNTDTPEGNLVGETISVWSAPKVNYPLTIENVRKFRERLVTGRNPFAL